MFIDFECLKVVCIVDGMLVDEWVDFFCFLFDDVSVDLLVCMLMVVLFDVCELLCYLEGLVGGWMIIDFVVFVLVLMVECVIDEVWCLVEDKEIINEVYVVDFNGILFGLLFLSVLVLVCVG